MMVAKKNNPSIPNFSPEPVQQLLLTWYTANKRDLPWRLTRDPYAILVSEIMLQQTQVDRVIPKYHAFLTAFPDFSTLASAPTDAVIRQWSGLGYNQRALRLQQIARAIIEQYGGIVPQTLEGWLALPGIGRYTAGAIACFALGQTVATVDTNIRRVLVRIFVGELSDTARMFESADAALILAEMALPPDASRAYEWNQSLMDLGATICQSRQPLCENCPIATHCRTYEQLAPYALFPTGALLRDLRQSQVAEKGVPYKSIKPNQPFNQTSRFYRGRIVAVLGQQPSSKALTLFDLGPIIKDDFTDDDLPWLKNLLAGLVRDGLVAWENAEQTLVRLP
jgi:A/G-specific adenine glycosylase